MKKKRPEKPMEGTVLPPATPPTYPIRLANLENVKVELARVYRDARQGRLNTDEASRLAYILYQLRGVIEAIQDNEFSTRLAIIEARLNPGGANVIKLAVKAPKR